MIPNRAHPLPLTVLTGFLGAGKTTLLNRLLARSELSDALVLVNEVGEIGIDHLLVRHVREELVLLASGCVCCTLRGDLVAQLESLLRQRDAGEIPPFSRLILETTGLADPAPVAQTIVKHPLLSERVYLSGIVTMVDAQHGEQALQSQDVSRRQVAVADRIVVTKADLVDEAQLARVEALVHGLHPQADVRRSANGEIDPRYVLDPGHLDTRSILSWESEHGHRHAAGGPHGVESVVVTLERPVDFRAFAFWVSMLTQLNGPRILRLKAVVSARGEPAPIAVQAVQHVVYPPLDLPPLPELAGKSHVVVLTQGMSREERDELRAGLEGLPS